MDTLTLACSAAWLAVGAYLGWMAIQHARLARRVDRLRDASIETNDLDCHAKAA